MRGTRSRRGARTSRLGGGSGGGGGGGPAWDPSQLTNAVGWWRADLGHSLSDTDPVTTWANQISGVTDGDLTAGSGYEPTYDAAHASFNNQAVIDFPGGKNLVSTISSWWELPADDSDYTLVLVFRGTTNGGSRYIWYPRQANTRGGMTFYASPNFTSYATTYGSGGSPFISHSVADVVQNTAHVVSIKWTGATAPSADTQTVYLDGVQKNTGTNNVDRIEASIDREVIIGSNSVTTGAFQGQIAEMIFTHANLTAGEESSLTTYLNDRYAFSLPGVTP